MKSPIPASTIDSWFHNFLIIVDTFLLLIRVFRGTGEGEGPFHHGGYVDKVLSSHDEGS